uniref:EF-hand domain-containing protein n=1 Tax=Parastrongyloides trichosuri TaxID=131310 RepID=A0A0N4ZNU7_PARTI
MANRIIIEDVSFNDNPSKFTDNIKLSIKFQTVENIEPGTKFELVYVGDPSSRNYDQSLDTIEFENIPIGIHTVTLEVNHPDVNKIPQKDLVGATAIILDCYYKEQLFAQTSWFVSVEYTDPELVENPPLTPIIEKLSRTIDTDDPRTCLHTIKWSANDDVVVTPVTPIKVDDAGEQDEEVIFSAADFTEEELKKLENEAEFYESSDDEESIDLSDEDIMDEEEEEDGMAGDENDVEDTPMEIIMDKTTENDNKISTLQQINKLSLLLVNCDREAVREFKELCNKKIEVGSIPYKTIEAMVKRMFDILDPVSDINDKMCKIEELKECLFYFEDEAKNYVINSLIPAFFVYKDYENRNGLLRVPEIQYFLRKKFEKKLLYKKLVLYDRGYTGYILKDDIEQYCHDTLLKYNNDYFRYQDKRFFDECIQHAVMKIKFFELDKTNKKFEIRKLLLSPRIEEFENVIDVPIGVNTNWYAPAKVSGFKTTFQNLDLEDKGYLSLEEFKRLDSNYSSLFYERTFEVLTHYKNEFTLENFKLLFLILENRHEYRAQKLFFEILDINGDGYLCFNDIIRWFSSLKKLFTMNTEDDFPKEIDFVNQLFDFLLIPPSETRRITLDDIYKSRKGEQFYGMLINCLLYLSFENPEDSSEEVPTRSMTMRYGKIYYYDRMGNKVQAEAPYLKDDLDLCGINRKGESIIKDPFPREINDVRYDINYDQLPLQSTSSSNRTLIPELPEELDKLILNEKRQDYVEDDDEIEKIKLISSHKGDKLQSLTLPETYDNNDLLSNLEKGLKYENEPFNLRDYDNDNLKLIQKNDEECCNILDDGLCSACLQHDVYKKAEDTNKKLKRDLEYYIRNANESIINQEKEEKLPMNVLPPFDRDDKSLKNNYDKTKYRKELEEEIEKRRLITLNEMEDEKFQNNKRNTLDAMLYAEERNLREKKNNQMKEYQGKVYQNQINKKNIKQEESQEWWERRPPFRIGGDGKSFGELVDDGSHLIKQLEKQKLLQISSQNLEMYKANIAKEDEAARNYQKQKYNVMRDDIAEQARLLRNNDDIKQQIRGRKKPIDEKWKEEVFKKWAQEHENNDKKYRMLQDYREDDHIILGNREKSQGRKNYLQYDLKALEEELKRNNIIGKGEEKKETHTIHRCRRCHRVLKQN